MLAGLTYPYTFLDGLRIKIEENQESIMRNLGATQTKRLSNDINFLVGLGGLTSSRPVQPLNASKPVLAQAPTALAKPDRQAIFEKYRRK